MSDTKELGTVNPIELTELPSDPVLRQELKDGIDQIIGFMIVADQQNVLRREALTALAKKTGVKSKFIAKYARWKLSGTASKEVTELSAAEAAFEILYNPNAKPVDSLKDST